LKLVKGFIRILTCWWHWTRSRIYH
jgi:hypothetical protein